jgi:hypothetical protein
MEIDREMLVKNLKKMDAEVTFTKLNGDVRVIKCTLQKSVVPEKKTTPAESKVVNPDVLPVWDIEKSAWRSFRYDTITNVKFMA